MIEIKNLYLKESSITYQLAKRNYGWFFFCFFLFLVVTKKVKKIKFFFFLSIREWAAFSLMLEICTQCK